MLLGGAALVGKSGARYVFAALLTGYVLLFVSRLGQTPAQDRLNVKVARVGSNQTPGLVCAARRWILPLALFLAPDLRVAALLLLVIVLPALLPGRRGAHDLLGGTWVISYDADEEEGEDGPEADIEPLDRLRRQRRILRFDRDDPT